MDEAWLSSRLESGRSIESLAREVGRDASTVSYWVKKYGLTSKHAERHAARGGIERETLEALVTEGLRCRAEAAKCVLLCSNCHAEVEDGVATIPIAAQDVSSG